MGDDVASRPFVRLFFFFSPLSFFSPSRCVCAERWRGPTRCSSKTWTEYEVKYRGSARYNNKKLHQHKNLQKLSDTRKRSKELLLIIQRGEKSAGKYFHIEPPPQQNCPDTWENLLQNWTDHCWQKKPDWPLNLLVFLYHNQRPTFKMDKEEDSVQDT